MSVRLYSYWRSSAAYRVRIALNLVGVEYEIVPVDLARGEQNGDAYRRINPQGLVPFLDDGSVATGQSLAILEYLDEAYSTVPLLPAGNPERSAVRAFCNTICCDVHPLNNLRVLNYLSAELGADDDARDGWYAHWVQQAFRALEPALAARGGPYCFGRKITMADLCLVPQVYNARRFDVPLDDYPSIVAVDAACRELEAFDKAAPENQPDAPDKQA